MRISRGRFHLRVVLLLVGGGFMAWRAWETRGAALSRSGADRVLGERLALVMVLAVMIWTSCLTSKGSDTALPANWPVKVSRLRRSMK